MDGYVNFDWYTNQNLYKRALCFVIYTFVSHWSINGS